MVTHSNAMFKFPALYTAQSFAPLFTGARPNEGFWLRWKDNIKMNIM
jgi:hypothetical protein